MKIPTFQRIVKEDFKKDDQDAADKLGYVLNNFCETLVTALNKRLTIADNLAMEYKTLTLTVDSTGKPISATSFTTALGQLQGIIVVQAINITNSITYPTAAPWVSWTQKGTSVVVNNISGLQANNKYQLTLETRA